MNAILKIPPEKFERIFIHSVPHYRTLNLALRARGLGCIAHTMPYAPNLVGNPDTDEIHEFAIFTLNDATCTTAIQTRLDKSHRMTGANFITIQQGLTRLPYVQMLGFELSFDQSELTGHLPFADHLIGNPLVPAFHGGVIAALLHLTASDRLMLETQSATPPQIFTATNEYLANPQLKPSHAAATLVTRTRRFANLRAIAWQEYRAAPIAAATLQFLIA